MTAVDPVTPPHSVDETDLHRRSLLVGGRLVPAAGDERIDVVSPFTEEVIGSVPRVTHAEAEAAMAAARAAFEDGPWPRMAPGERAAAIRRLADALVERRDEAAWLYSLETGVPISTAPALGTVTDIVLRAYADLAVPESFVEHRHWLGADLTVRQEPVGVTLGISPWNAPGARPSAHRSWPPRRSGWSA